MERKLTGSTLFPCGPATRRPGGVVRWLLLFFVFGSRMIAAGAQGMPEAAPPRLQIAAIERSDFPTVGLNLIATSPSSERREIVEGLRLWENGVPVADFTLEPVTVGVELFLLLDLEPAWADTGEDGVTSPLLLVRDSLLRLAGRHLERDRDRLWVGAGDGEETEWLVQQAPDPGSLINALDEVEAPPERGSAPPDPQALLAMALDSAEATPTRQVASGRLSCLRPARDSAPPSCRALRSGRAPASFLSLSFWSARLLSRRPWRTPPGSRCRRGAGSFTWLRRRRLTTSMRCLRAMPSRHSFATRPSSRPGASIRSASPWAPRRLRLL